MSLNPTFALTPKAPIYYVGPQNSAVLFCYGADFTYVAPNNFSNLYATDRFFFDASFAADPTLDYAAWANRKPIPVSRSEFQPSEFRCAKTARTRVRL